MNDYVGIQNLHSSLTTICCFAPSFVIIHAQFISIICISIIDGRSFLYFLPSFKIKKKRYTFARIKHTNHANTQTKASFKPCVSE